MSLVDVLRGLVDGVRPSIAIAGLLVGVLIFWSGISTWRQYSRLRDFKGPRLAGFSKWWLIRTVGSGRAYLDFWEVTKKYGKLRRIVLTVALVVNCASTNANNAP
jgi:hypothetical protein